MPAFRREVAKRIFAKEYNDSSITFKGDDRYSPLYLLTPTGLKCNRIFVVGILLEKDDVGGEGEFWRIRVSDHTGAFVGYVGRYQPEALQSLASIEPPQYVAVSGKVNVYEGENRVLVSIRPEEISVSDARTREIWTLETARYTLDRIEALEKLSTEEAKLAMEKYSPDPQIYRDMVKEALRALMGDMSPSDEEKKEEPEEEMEEELLGEPSQVSLDELDEILMDEEWDLSKF